MKPTTEIIAREDIDVTKWGKKFEPTDKANGQPQINCFILNRHAWFELRGYQRETLWENTQIDFDGWTLELWEAASQDIVRDFRDLLRYRGVYISKERK